MCGCGLYIIAIGGQLEYSYGSCRLYYLPGTAKVCVSVCVSGVGGLKTCRFALEGHGMLRARVNFTI